jgi:hypothetical protein
MTTDFAQEPNALNNEPISQIPEELAVDCSTHPENTATFTKAHFVPAPEVTYMFDQSATINTVVFIGAQVPYYQTFIEGLIDEILRSIRGS